mmetsp:Transcript_20451/g.31921  ORF Transcript_20451/g.31921 Transcript_20451/m.31921 type:complete len:327 (+) Transcript_20451:1375-2355(+)
MRGTSISTQFSLNISHKVLLILPKGIFFQGSFLNLISSNSFLPGGRGAGIAFTAPGGGGGPPGPPGGGGGPPPGGGGGGGGPPPGPPIGGPPFGAFEACIIFSHSSWSSPSYCFLTSFPRAFATTPISFSAKGPPSSALLFPCGFHCFPFPFLGRSSSLSYSLSSSLSSSSSLLFFFFFFAFFSSGNMSSSSYSSSSSPSYSSPTRSPGLHITSPNSSCSGMLGNRIGRAFSTPTNMSNFLILVTESLARYMGKNSGKVILVVSVGSVKTTWLQNISIKAHIFLPLTSSLGINNKCLITFKKVQCSFNFLDVTWTFSAISATSFKS